MFKVTVADNFHYLDFLNFRVVGEYETWPEAIAAARGVVEGSLAELHKPGMTAEELFHEYALWGDDPIIQPIPDFERFTGWGWARERCTALCADVTRPSRPLKTTLRLIIERILVDSTSYGGCTEHKVTPRGEMIYHFPFTAGLGWLMYRMRYREKIGEVPDWVTLEHPQHRACILKAAVEYELPVPEERPCPTAQY